jgi:ribonuclease III
MTDLRTWLRDTLGHDPADLALFERALTHGSVSKETYERLEFVGDRVVGLAIARWLYERFPGESEGKLSRRYNVLVSRETCAEIGREIGLPGWIKLGKQARDDRANQSDNVIGDVVEALIGALLLDGGLDTAEAFVRRAWASYVESQDRAPKHPKSALQELAAAKEWAPPEYEIERKSGAHHAPRFTVRVLIKDIGEAAAEGSSKQEAETAAASALLERLR